MRESPNTVGRTNTMADAAATDIIVIGAGIAGASVAARLAAQRSVLLLEREPQPGYHSTGRSAAMFMESYGPPAVRALTRASRQFYLHPPAGFTDVALLGPRGAMFLAQTGQQDLLRKLQLELGATCPQLQLLDRQQTLAMLPLCGIYAIWQAQAGHTVFGGHELSTAGLLVGAGILTALPLMAFAAATQRLDLATVGMLMYINPTMQFVTAVWIFGEPMQTARLFSFALIWAGLLVFSWSVWGKYRNRG